jgi:hypothetical protein
MKEVSPNICSAVTMIICTISKAPCKCTWAERSTSAGLYQGEILGGVMTQLILKAAASACHYKIPPVVVDCGRGCTREFLIRKSKKTIFGSTYTTKIGQAGPAERNFINTLPCQFNQTPCSAKSTPVRKNSW